MTHQDPAITLDRLRRIPGWSPEREPRCVWIRGGGDAAALLAIALAGLGARRVVLHQEAGQQVPSRIAPRLTWWLDDVRFEVRNRGYGRDALALALEALEVKLFVDLAGGSQDGLRAAVSAGIPAYATSLWGGRLSFSLADRSLEPLPRSDQASIEAVLALAGFLSHDYANRFVLQLPSDLLPPETFRFDISRPWTDPHEPAPPQPITLSRPLRVLLVGAGGLGCPAAVALANRLPDGSRVVVCDFDRVDPTNRNRQFLFNSVDAGRGAPKPEALCREARPLNPKLEWVGVNGAFPNRIIHRYGPFDCAFALTDSFASRLAIDRARVAPVLIDAAVDERSAYAALFHDGTAQMSEALGLEEAAARESGRASCGRAEPSIVSTNFIGAALAVSLLSRHLAFGPEPARLYSYEYSTAERGGAWPPFPEAGR